MLRTLDWILLDTKGKEYFWQGKEKVGYCYKGRGLPQMIAATKYTSSAHPELWCRSLRHFRDYNNNNCKHTVIYKIITKLSLPALLGALCLHLIVSSQELSHTEKHSTGKTRKCAKNDPENFLKNKIILFAAKCNCRSKFCKEDSV